MYYICKFDRDFGDTQVDGAFSNKDKAKEECKYLNMCDGYTDDDCIVPYYVVKVEE